MAAVDRSSLIQDILYWLPENNSLDKTSLTKLTGLVISRIGDDESKYAQILCESLHAAAVKNSLEGTAGREIKKETVGGQTREYFEGGDKEFWNQFIKDLDFICPAFGYTKPVSLGIKIAPGKAMSILGEDLETLF